MKQFDLEQIPLRPLLVVQGSLAQRGQYVGRCSRLIGAMLTLALMVPAAAVSQAVFPNPAPVDLGAAGTYRALAGSGLVIDAACTVHGNVGGGTISNAGTVTGTSDTANSAWTTAISALNTAFAELLSRPVDSTFGVADLGGMTLGRGVYQANASGTFGLSGTLTLTGVATDTFIIRTGVTGIPGASLITSASSIVTMGGTALASNVFWVIGTSAELAASSVFKGNILAGTSILQDASVTFDGRALGKSTVTLNGTSVLPVELVTFTATANRLPAGGGFNADLHWSTATEANNYGFEIERRQNANWEKVGFVAGAGTSSSPRDYSYTDNNLSPGRYAYRIKQVDKNGSFSYRGSAEVEIGSAPKKFELESNYPNPFNPSTTIEFMLADDGLASLTVYNMLGQKMMTLFDGNAQAGRLYQVKFNASSLPSGLYVAKLESGKQHTMRKMVLMK